MNTLAPNELIVEVIVPRQANRSVYLKAMDRATWAYALVSVAAAAEITDGVLRNVRIVLGAVGNTPMRALQAEAMVEGQPFEENRVRQAAEAAIADAQPLEHNRYKLPLTRNLVAQALRDLMQ
jgi:xanthine dehydrogenase YagS FAD-binding subunit